MIKTEMKKLRSEMELNNSGLTELIKSKLN